MNGDVLILGSIDRFRADDVGTSFWHAHSGFQRADGVYGPLIVREYDRNDVYRNRYDYDLREHVITVSDWTNMTTLEKFTGHFHNDVDNKANDILINGMGVLAAINGTFKTPRATFRVKSGFRYRFRLINAGVLYCPIQFSIDEHNMTIIATDGKPVESVVVQSIVIYAGERFDFILEANQPATRNYWIKAKGFADCSNYKCSQLAILSYEDGGQDENASPTAGIQVNDNMTVPGLVFIFLFILIYIFFCLCLIYVYFL